MKRIEAAVWIICITVIAILFVLVFGKDDEIKIDNNPPVIEDIPEEKEEKIIIDSISNEEIYLMAERTCNKKFEDYMNRLANAIDSEERLAIYVEYRCFMDEHGKYVSDPPETIFDVFTEEERELVYRTVETECYQCDFDSKTHIASTIFNRLESDIWSDDITEIITSPNQFVYGRTTISEDTKLAVEYAYEFGDTVQGATFFNCLEAKNSWNGASYVFTDDAGVHYYAVED